MQDLHVRKYMTSSPLTIDRHLPLKAAEKLMQEHHIRHLPVMDGDKLVGIVAAPELSFLAALAGLDPARMPVGEVMTRAPYAVAPDADLYQVTQYFLEHKETAAVVVDADKVVGVLTTIDALRALMDLLAEARRVLK
jgi:acetoin utilization protein AcuB